MRQPHQNNDKSMSRKQTPKPPQPVAEAESLVGVASTDLFAFVGVRKIIGDPLGRLMQDEVADRIQKLVNVLRETVGVMDSLDIMRSHPSLTAGERKMMTLAMREIREALDSGMPEWDDVCKAIHEANGSSEVARRGEKEGA